MKKKLLLFTLMLMACINSLYADDYVPDMTKALKIDDWGTITNNTDVTVKDATGKFIVDIAGGGAKIKTEASKQDMYLNPLNILECPMANGMRLTTGGKAGSMTLTLPAETGGLYIYTHVGSSGYGRSMNVTKKSESITILPPNTKISGINASGATKTGYESQKVYITKPDIDTKNNNVTIIITWDASIYICGFCFVPGEKIPDDYFEVQPYALYDNGTLTFRYDNQWGETDGTAYAVSSNDIRTWDDIAGSTTNVVFDSSFAQCTDITSTYGWFAGFTSLTSITGWENLNTQNVTNMYSMFYNCSSLTSLDVSNFDTRNVTNMSGMFAGCSGLTTIRVNVNTQNVTNMSGMFYGCSGLTSIDVSNFSTNNVTNMSSMFYGCTGLSVIDLRNFNIESLTDATDIYAACSDNLIVYLPEGWNADKVTRIASLVPIGNFLYDLYKDKHAILAYLNYPVTITGDVVVPSKIADQGNDYSVTKVNRISWAPTYFGSSTFTYLADEEYAKVTSLTFEDGIEEIDDRNIAYYSHCASINIPKSVKYISSGTYQLYGASRSYGDYSYNDITFNVDAENPVYCSVDGVLYDKDMKTLLRCPRNMEGTFTVPETVETIGDLAFANCNQLNSIELPKGLKSIGTEDEPANYFEGVFQRCSALYEINIPAGVTYIGTSAFSNCNYLEKITCFIKNPEGYNDDNRFPSRVYSNATLYVPYGTKDKYLAADGWNNFGIVEMDEVTAIESVVANTPTAVFGKIHSIDGKQLSQPQKGLNLIRMSDGTTKKMVR